jgi:hypothetical protein
VRVPIGAEENEFSSTMFLVFSHERDGPLRYRLFVRLEKISSSPSLDRRPKEFCSIALELIAELDWRALVRIDQPPQQRPPFHKLLATYIDARLTGRTPAALPRHQNRGRQSEARCGAARLGSGRGSSPALSVAASTICWPPP